MHKQLMFATVFIVATTSYRIEYMLRMLSRVHIFAAFLPLYSRISSSSKYMLEYLSPFLQEKYHIASASIRLRISIPL